MYKEDEPLYSFFLILQRCFLTFVCISEITCVPSLSYKICALNHLCILEMHLVTNAKKKNDGEIICGKPQVF